MPRSRQLSNSRLLRRMRLCCVCPALTLPSKHQSKKLVRGRRPLGPWGKGLHAPFVFLSPRAACRPCPCGGPWANGREPCSPGAYPSTRLPRTASPSSLESVAPVCPFGCSLPTAAPLEIRVSPLCPWALSDGSTPSSLATSLPRGLLFPACSCKRPFAAGCLTPLGVVDSPLAGPLVSREPWPAGWPGSRSLPMITCSFRFRFSLSGT
jgi:hypothetical protein